MKKIILLITVSLVLTACATTPIPTNEAKDVPLSRVYQQGLLESKNNTGIVIVKRDSGFGGSACSHRIYVDGQVVADLNVAEKVIINPSIGKRILSAQPNGICGGGMVEIESDVSQDKILIYRTGYGSNGDFGLYRTAF